MVVALRIEFKGKGSEHYDDIVRFLEGMGYKQRAMALAASDAKEAEAMDRLMIAGELVKLAKDLMAKRSKWELRKLRRVVHEVMLDFAWERSGEITVDVETETTFPGTGPTWDHPGDPAEWRVYDVDGDYDVKNVKVPIDKFVKAVGKKFRFPEASGDEINDVVGKVVWGTTAKSDDFEISWSSEHGWGSVYGDVEVTGDSDGRYVHLFIEVQNQSNLDRAIASDARG
jgi:hypothetical protein